MSIRKSQLDVEFYVGLFENVLRDAYAYYPEIPRTEFDRDMKSVRTRVQSEGFSFLAVQLPTLRKAIDRSLETGELIVPDGFGRKTKAGVRWNIPRLFSALFLTSYTLEGALRHEKTHAIGALRHVCDLCYKVMIPPTDQALEKAADRFVEIDESLASVSTDLKYTPAFRKARLILAKLFEDFDPSQITPRHGPGAVAEKLRARSKYDFNYYDPEIDQLYPYVTNVTFGVLAQTPETLVRHTTLDRDVSPSRVCFVPKDSRGPRVIAAEPALLQYLQQGLGRAIVDHVEKHPLTKGHVLFTDQHVHRRLAERSSVNRRFATLDLKDASDRVSLDLVESLFPEKLLPYLKALRSRRAALPDGRVVSLKKFASMGSALCFPVEALTFFALAAGSLWAVSRRRVSSSSVFVYGDDLIVPTQYAGDVVSGLEQYGVRFNPDKCYIRGSFRESCGKDVFRGEDVTPIRLRAMVTTSPGSRKANLNSLSKNATAFFDHGYWCAARYLDSYVEKHWGLPIPTALSTFPGLCRTSEAVPMKCMIPHGVIYRWRTDLQRIEIRTLVLRARVERSPFPSSVCRLGHNLIQGVSEAYLEEVAVPHSALTKAVWACL